MKRRSQAKFYPMLLYRTSLKVDSIAEDCLLDPHQPQTSNNAAHADAQAISICIQGTRVTGRYEDAICESIDGSYLREYLSAKHA
jgi:hypothetical protein